MVSALIGLALLVYIWKNRSDIAEFCSSVLKVVRWSRRVVKQALYVAGISAVTYAIWAYDNAHWQHELDAYVKAHPEYTQKAKDLSSLSPKVTLFELQSERSARTEEVERHANEVKQRTEEANTKIYFAELEKLQADGAKKLPSFDEFMAKQHPADQTALSADKVETIKELYSRIATLPPEKAAIVTELANRIRITDPVKSPQVTKYAKPETHNHHHDVKVTEPEPTCPVAETFTGTWEELQLACDKRKHG